MELLLDNLKNVLFKGKHAKSGLEVIPDKSLILRIIVVGCISLLMGRAALCYSLEPCALALMTALMTRSKANIYALPMICLGIISASWTSFHYFGDVFTLILCSLIYLVIGTKKLNLIFRALISAVTMVSVKTIYYLWTGLFFLYDSLTVALDILILFTFIYVFWKFFRLIEKGIQKESAVEILAIVSVIIMVATSGIGVVQFGPVSLLHIVALFITLLIGHNIGPSEGALVGIINGLFTMFAALDTPAFIGILGCSGMVAGIFKGQRRIISGICFGGIALAFGSIKGFPDLYLSIYEPVIAAGIYILIPKPVIERIGKLFSFIQQDDSYYESLAKKRVGEQLKEYQNLFQKLALTSGTMGTFNPARDIVTQQFKGMAVALKKMSESMAEKNEPIIPKKPRYKVQLGVAGYAKEGKVSGDSYLCTGIREGEYLIALSDGMGKGLRASEESMLTVNTLHNLLKAGFETELALKMINSILLLKSKDEIFSTVDMGFINLYNGRAKFFKIGAAASFIKRGDEVKVIKMSALPMGIIERVPVESITLQLRKGDQLIIVSDGITEADRDRDGAGWVKEAICEIRSKDPQTMADLILNRAIQQYGLREKDDMTVITAIIT